MSNIINFRDERMAVSLMGNSLAFKAQGISIPAVFPYAKIKIGKNERETILKPEGEPEVSLSLRRTSCAGEEVRQYDLTWRYTNGCALSWNVGLAPKLPGVLLCGAFYNGSGETVRLSEIGLADTGDGYMTAEGAPEAWNLSSVCGSQRAGNLSEVLPSANELTLRIQTEMNDFVGWKLSEDSKSCDGRYRSYTDFLSLFTENGKKGIAMGPFGELRADINYDCFVDNGRVRMTIASVMSDIVVESGQTLWAQEMAVIADSYTASVTKLLHEVAQTHGHRTHRKPLCGWCSWYDKGSAVREEDVLPLAAKVKNNRDRLPMDVIQLDDGYEECLGDWRCNEKFPNGFPAMVKAIEDADAIPGIWMAPLWVHDCMPFVKQHPDWLQRDSHGKPCDKGTWTGKTSCYLDPTHPEVQQLLRNMLRNMRNEGFRYFKFDFNNVSNSARFYNPHLTRLEAFRELFRLYREELGEDCFLLACTGTVARGVAGFADAVRIGTDSAPRWDDNVPWNMHKALKDTGDSAIANGVLFVNDPDVTYTKARERINDHEQKTWHGFVGLLGGMQMVSEPLHRDDYAGTLRMFEILTPPAPEKGRSFHGGADSEHRQFGISVHRPWGSFAAVQLWNPNDAASSEILDISCLELEGARFHVWSFWDRHYLGLQKDGFSIGSMLPHDSAILRITPEGDKNMPLIVGSDLHISMGAAELADVLATPKSLKIHLTDAGARDGFLAVYSMGNITFKSYEGFSNVAIIDCNEQIWTLKITGREKGHRQTIDLEIVR